MKIIAWNVNGIRSLLKTDYLTELIKQENPDVICFGETKISCPYVDTEDELKKVLPKLKHYYWSPCKTRKGYSGTVIISKKEPISISYGLKYKNKEIDDEGRVIVVEYKRFYLLHVYTPNSGQALARLEWRTNVWDKAFLAYINDLQKLKPIIVCGDLNVAHKEIDLKNPKSNLKTAGYTVEERNSFDTILKDCNLIDTYRTKNPNKIEYSYWSYRFNSRVKDVGWRIDYFLSSYNLQKKVKESSILVNILGSDHAPIKLII